MVGSLLVIGYALFLRERGPDCIGVLALVIALLTVGGTDDESPTLAGWPLFLLAGALLLILASFRRPAARR